MSIFKPLFIAMIILCCISVNHGTNSLFIGAPRNVTVSNKTSTSLQIAWEAIQNDTILGYRICYGLNGTSYIITNCSCSNHSAIFVCYNITSIWLRNLEVYTRYWIEVIAFTNETFGNESLSDVFRTDEDVPSSPPAAVVVANQSSTSVSVSWRRVPKEHRRGKIIAYVVKITDVSTETSTEKVYNDSNILNVTIDGLKKYTLYRVTVSAKTSKGASNASREYKLRTAEDAPDDPPTKINFTGITSNSIVVTWGPVPDGRLNGILRAYTIRWKAVNSGNGYSIKTIDITSSISARKRRSVSPSSNQTSFTMTNLSLYTNYSVEVSAKTIREGPFSDTVYIFSGEGVPTAPPVNVTAYNTSSTGIYVMWSPPPENTIPGVLLGYEISYIPAMQDPSQNASGICRVMLCACNTSFELKNLSIYTPYNITVAAFTKVGIGNESDIVRTWTDEAAPSAPINVTAVSRTFSSIHVSWNRVPEKLRFGIIIKYQVMVRQPPHNVSFVNYTTDKLEAEIPDLEMFVEYGVGVRAFTRIGPGRYSEPFLFLKTKETAPSVIPANVSGHPTSSSSIRVTWDIVRLERGFKLRHFVVSYRAFENNTWGSEKEMKVLEPRSRRSPRSPRRMANLTGLRVFTKYEIKVAAATNYTGNYSQPINVTTREGVPQAPPQDVRAVPETVSSIRVTWDPVPEPDRNGNITGYRIQVMNSSLAVVANINITVCAKDRSAVIGNLTMFVTYSVRVQAFTVAGAGQFSPYVNTSTNQTVPNVLLNVTATATSNSSIDVKWDIQRIHPQLNNSLKYRVSYCPTKGCGERNITETSGKMAKLQNLLTYVEYEIKVQPINITAKDGTTVEFPEGNYSNPVNETTLQGVPQGPPTKVKAEPESTTSIKVSWHEVHWKKIGGVIIQYILELHNGSQKIGDYNVSGNELSYVVKGLQVFSNYSARVQAVTALGAGPFSGFENTSTHQPAPNVVPQNVRAEATESTTIKVSWDKVDVPHNIGFQGYLIKYEAVKNPRLNGTVHVDKNTLEKNLTNLKAFTEYKIQVAARTTQAGNYSNPAKLRTKEGVPTLPPSKPYPEILDSISARINWDPVPDGHHNGIIRGYRVFYKTTGNDTYQEKETIAKAKALLLTGLVKAAKYDVKVLAFTNAGNGKSYNFTFSTLDDIPSRPPAALATVSKVSPRSINVTWKPVPQEFMHGTLVHYEVTYQPIEVGDITKEEEPMQRIIVEAGQTFKVLENLEPYVEYRISVAARTAKGLGPRAFALGETCHCGSHLTTSWRRYEPYVNISDDGEPGQIIPKVLQSMVDECCGLCDAFSKTLLDFNMNGNNKPSAKNTSRDLLESLEESTDFTFPVYGHKNQDSYKGGYGYIPVIESAGVAFIVYPEVSTTQTSMFNSMLRCLPVLVLPILTAYIAGVIIWFLERSNNPDDFPPSFLHGVWEGVWWAFVSMTTLGYGDRAPLSYKGRIFAIAWILFGLIVIAITMAMLTTALTTVTLKSEPKLYGSKIAAEYNSPEYHLGTRRNAKYDPDKEYHSLEEITQALINREVEGILVDSYSAGLRDDLFNRPEIRVSKIIDYKTAYGIVLSPNSRRLRKCFDRYVASQRAEIFEMIKKKVKPIETSSANTTKPAIVPSGGLLDSSSPTFHKALRYACVLLGIALFFSLMFECIRRMRTRDKVQQEVQFKAILQKEMCSLVKEFRYRMQKIREELGQKHRKQIIRFWKLKRKTSSEGEWLRISRVSVSSHPKHLTITDYY